MSAAASSITPQLLTQQLLTPQLIDKSSQFVESDFLALHAHMQKCQGVTLNRVRGLGQLARRFIYQRMVTTAMIVLLLAAIAKLLY